MRDPTQPSPWRLRCDIAFAKVVIWFAGVGQREKLSPEAHVFLYDRYWRLAKWHELRGRNGASRRLKTVALFHWDASGYDDPPPAAALAMPVPYPPSFTNAVAKTHDHGSGNSAA